MPTSIREIISLPRVLHLRYKAQDLSRIGKLGEELAGRYLRLRGYKIIAQNYRVNLGEIDFIARDKADLVFVEVKTRSSTAYGVPSEAVTDTKKHHMSRVALVYLKQRRLLRAKARFDVVSIILNKKQCVARIRLIKNAFSLSEQYRY